jgi:hypothetical protein
MNKLICTFCQIKLQIKENQLLVSLWIVLSEYIPVNMNFFFSFVLGTDFGSTRWNWCESIYFCNLFVYFLMVIVVILLPLQKLFNMEITEWMHSNIYDDLFSYSQFFFQFMSLYVFPHLPHPCFGPKFGA